MRQHILGVVGSVTCLVLIDFAAVH